MQIVPQSALFSPSVIPLQPPYLLAAPPIRLALPAPHIAGLLPALTPLRFSGWQVERINDRAKSIEEILREIGPIRSKAEMDAEIDEIVERGDRRIRQMWEAAQSRRSAARP